MQENPNQAPRQSRLQKMFGSRKDAKIKEDMPKIDVKGHKAFGKVHGKG